METALFVGVVVLVFVFLILWRAAVRSSQTAYKRGVEAGREDSRKRARSVNLGQVVEHLVPFMPDFPFDPKDARFLGAPVDYIVFAGLREDDRVDEVVFVEIKSGKSKLSTRERSVKEAVEDGRVAYYEMRVDPDNTGNIDGTTRKQRVDHEDGVFLNVGGEDLVAGRYELVCRHCKSELQLVGTEDDPQAVRCAACTRELAFEVATEGAIAAAVEERLLRDLADVARESLGTVTVRQTQTNLPDFVVRGPL